MFLCLLNQNVEQRRTEQTLATNHGQPYFSHHHVRPLVHIDGDGDSEYRLDADQEEVYLHVSPTAA